MEKMIISTLQGVFGGESVLTALVQPPPFKEQQKSNKNKEQDSNKKNDYLKLKFRKQSPGGVL